MRKVIYLLFSIIFMSCNKSGLQDDKDSKENTSKNNIENSELKKETANKQNKIDSLEKILSKSESDLIQESLQSNKSNKEELFGEDKIIDVIKNQKPSFDMIEASVLEYAGQKITLYGYVKLSDLFFEKYSGMQKNYYCINMLDNKIMSGGPIFVYFPKKANKELFEYIGMAGKHIPMKIVGIIKKSKLHSDPYNDRHTATFEGLSWTILK